MAQVSVSVGGRSYLLACEDGQEERLTVLAGYLDDKLQNLMRANRQAADQRLIVIASLLIADELFDLREGVGAAAAAGNGGQARATEDYAAAALDACANRIEALAARAQEA